MIILGDQPGIGPEIINEVARYWRESDYNIVLSSYRGRRGHPMVFAKTFFDKLSNLHGDKAAWKLVDANPVPVGEIEFDLPFPEDIDTRGDFERLNTDDHTPAR
jgi:molybdenum cofactor cytidylyltransferase